MGDVEHCESYTSRSGKVVRPEYRVGARTGEGDGTHHSRGGGVRGEIERRPRTGRIDNFQVIPRVADKGDRIGGCHGSEAVAGKRELARWAREARAGDIDDAKGPSELLPVVPDVPDVCIATGDLDTLGLDRVDVGHNLEVLGPHPAPRPTMQNRDDNEKREQTSPDCHQFRSLIMAHASSTGVYPRESSRSTESFASELDGRYCGLEGDRYTGNLPGRILLKRRSHPDRVFVTAKDIEHIIVGVTDAERDAVVENHESPPFHTHLETTVPWMNVIASVPLDRAPSGSYVPAGWWLPCLGGLYPSSQLVRWFQLIGESPRSRS